jgi:MOSC domain-containing protein YiiM
MYRPGECTLKLISVNVGQPREVDWHGRRVRTSIWKTPVPGRVRASGVNLEGDRQSDLSVHGGPDKAVYAYPSEHYAYWRRELPGTDLPWGAFGENFTVAGLLENRVKVGDRLRIGSAEFGVTQPRLPCFKLGIRFSRDAMVQQLFESGRTGFYLTILREGEVGSGDPITLTPTDEDGGSVAELFTLYGDKTADRTRLTRAIALPGLSASWRDHFRKQLEGSNR